MLARARNLYVHFPFCRRKCSYCALHSRPGRGKAERDAYAGRIAAAVRALPPQKFETVYFGGGSPALCGLGTVFDALAPSIVPGKTEFTVELHPLDIAPTLLEALAAGGVNRVSVGVQSTSDAVLRHMGRACAFAEIEKRFLLARSFFTSAGIDLIAGYPDVPGHDEEAARRNLERIADWGIAHCSAYTLILEEDSALGRAKASLRFPDDDAAMDEFASLASFLEGAGLRRYEISSFARPGFECRHNMATWSGEDYIGLGEGAAGRVGRFRTKDWWGGDGGVEETDAAHDALERKLFSLRTMRGLDAAGNPEWADRLDAFADEGLLEKTGSVYRLTKRGAEVCDTILAAIV